VDEATATATVPGTVGAVPDADRLIQDPPPERPQVTH
jgi:hypothetical protein